MSMSLPACVSVPDALGGLKKGPEPLKLELWKSERGRGDDGN